MIPARRAVLLCLALLGAGCSNSTGPMSAALNVSLTTPHTDDGAVLLAISGGPIDSIEPVGYSIYSAKGASDTVKLIVIGKIAPGTVARIHIPDSRRASSYTARVGQAAARATYVQRDPNRYAAVLLP